jgi:hypothetical protein
MNSADCNNLSGIAREKGGRSCIEKEMENAELLQIIKKLLKTDENLDFLLVLQENDLKTMVACIRERIDRAAANNSKPSA